MKAALGAKRFLRPVVGSFSALTFLATTLGAAIPAHAASPIPAAHGVNIQSPSSTYWGSTDFYQSLKNLAADHANTVVFVIPLQQSSATSLDIHTLPWTPTDAALTTAIQEAHTLGMRVVLKPHLDVTDGTWRAYINPATNDRTTWFNLYTSQLVHYAQLGQANNVEEMVLGTEMIDVSTTDNSTNTANWQTLIGKVRAVFTGKLGYAANWGTGWADEKNRIGFWKSLDFAGVDAYYPLSSSATPTSPADYVAYLTKTSDLPAFAKSAGVPVVITEVGYRSADGILTHPWDYTSGSSINLSLQADAYQALFSYLSTLSFVQGVYLWEWDSDPNSGGAGNDNYTPQNKPAETVMAMWFGGTGDATQGVPASALQPLTASAAILDGTSQVHVPVTITTTVQNSATYGHPNSIIDTEIYDQQGSRVFQNFSEGQNVTANGTLTRTAKWTPTAVGTYTMKVGVFGPNWSPTLIWNDNAGSYSVFATTTADLPPAATSTPIVTSPATTTPPVATTTQPIATTTTPVATSTPTAPVGPINPSAPPSFTAIIPALTTSVSTPITVTTSVADTGGALSNALVDLEVYDANNKQVYQTFMSNLTFAAGEQKPFSFLFTPSTTGTYRVAVGVFANDWSKNYFWTNSAGTITSSLTPIVVPPVVTPPATTTTPIATSTPGTPIVTTTTPVATTTAPIATTTTPVATSTTPVAPPSPVSTTTPPVVTPAPPVTPVQSAPTGTIYPGTTSARVGTSVDFSGRNFGHEEDVLITSSLGTIGTRHADGGGNFSTGSLSVPSNPGTYTYTFTGKNSGIFGTSIVTVTP